MARKKSSTASRRRSKSRSSRGKSSRSSKKQSAASIPLSLSRDRKLDLLGVLLLILGLFSVLSMLYPQQGKWTHGWMTLLRQVAGWGAYVIPVLLLAVGGWLLLRNVKALQFVIDIEQVLGALLLLLALLMILHLPVGGVDLATRLEPGKQGRGGGVIGAVLLSASMSAVGPGGTSVVLLAWILLAASFTAGLSVPELLSLLYRGLCWLIERVKPVLQQLRPKPNTIPKELQPVRRQASPAGSGSQQEADVGLQAEALSPVLPASRLHPVAWQKPQIETILEPGIEGRVDREIDQQRARLIEDTLQAFGAPARVVEINRGPTITQFGVEPDYVESRGGRRTKVKVSKISSLADDLALALAASSVRIEAPVPGKGFVGVEVPNEEVALVSLRDVMEAKNFQKLSAKSKLVLGLGQDVSGHAVCADLASMPHLLIAGTTGSGKSVCVNSIITSLLLLNTPDELKFVMIDPKRVELTFYNGVPHLLAPVVVDLERVVGALQWVSREMDERYRRFSKQGVRNIAEFNRLRGQDGGQRLPFLVVVIDELADLMMLAPDETERVITRLAQLARATGIHLVIATQRPSVDVVTGLIKANFPARVAFAVASSVDSRVILDQPGAERLLGKGDMLFQSPDAASPKRMQGAYVSEQELERLVRFWTAQALGAASGQPSPEAPESIPAGVPLTQAPLWDEDAPQDEQLDELYDQAVAIVREMRRASISLLQRRLRIGYTRSARLVDQLEERGIIGPAQRGSQPREVLDYGEIAPLDE